MRKLYEVYFRIYRYIISCCTSMGSRRSDGIKWQSRLLIQEEVTISAGESVHFVNNMLPPHNVIVEDRPDLGHEALAMLPGEEFDVAFPEAGDYTYWCGPHKGAGMIGTVHVE